MKKIFSYFKSQFSYLFINPFWKAWVNIILITITFLVSALLVYLYIFRFRQSAPIMPIIYSVAVFVLNVLLANISYRREPMVSYILLSAGLFVQILFLGYLQISILGAGF